MKFHRLFLFLGLVALLASGVACSQFFPAPPTPTRVPTLVPTITPILVILPSPTSAQIPTATRIATSIPSSSASSSIVSIPTSTPSINRISFPPGGVSASVPGTVTANGVDRYVLRALAGQVMSVTFTPAAENVTIQISGADGNVLVSGGAKFTTGVFNLPQTQDYFFSIISSRNTSTNYTLQITILPLQSPVPVTPTSAPRRITFTPGAISATVAGSTFTSGQDRFIIRALAGQTMTVNAASTQGPVILIVYGADGSVLLSDHSDASNWSGVLPSTQDYFIDTRSVGVNVVPFTLTVTIPPK